MKLPKRVKQHITETASFKIFRSKIPNNWIIREVTERDYGIDCYVELVTKKGELTGQLVSIQLKSSSHLKWNKKGKLTLSGIDIATTNYWSCFCVPVFIFAVDISAAQVFFLPVKNYIRKHYSEYAKQESFNYKFDKFFQFKGTEGIIKFIYSYHYESHRKNFESNLLTFVVNHGLYRDFISENTDLDCFLGVEPDRFLFLRHFYNNLRFLCEYLNIKWDIASFESYIKQSQASFGDIYELYEAQMDEIVTKLETKLSPIVSALKKVILESEKEYWLITNHNLFSFLLNI